MVATTRSNEGASARPPTLRGLTTIAMLKTYLDSGEDYVGIFRPFVVEAIASLGDPAFSVRSLQESLAGMFGLSIPEPTLRLMLSRLQKAGLLRREGGRYLRRAAVPRAEIQEATARIQDEHQRLALSLVEFAVSKGLPLPNPDVALDLLVRFLDEHRVELALNGVAQDTPGAAHQSGIDPRQSKLVALFLHERCLPDPSLAAVLKRLLEGLVLESTLLLRDIERARRNFKGLQVFLDTGFLLRALGYSGEPQANLARETLALFEATDARTLAFDVTLEEILRILAVYRDRLMTPAGREQLRFTDLTRHFREAKCTSADIAQEMALLPSHLSALGIGVTPVPRRQREYQSDEASLQEILRRPGGDPDEPRVLHDVDCVVGIAVLRRGRTATAWEDATAVFASTTAEVVAKIERWHSETGGRGLPPAVHVARLTNIAWLKNPQVGAALKQQELVALCSAALSPSESTWRQFVSHLRRMQDAGSLTSDEAVAVLASELTERMLGQLPVSEELDAETVAEVIERVQSTYREEAGREVAAAKEAAMGEVEEARRLHLEEQRRRQAAEMARMELEARLDATSKRVAAVVSASLCAVLGLVVIAGGLAGFGLLREPWPWWARIVLSTAAGFAVFFGTLGSLFGTSVGSVHGWLRGRMTGLLRGWLVGRR